MTHLIAQCVMCFRTAAAQQAERSHVLNIGILILLIPPVLIGACLLFVRLKVAPAMSPTSAARPTRVLSFFEATIVKKAVMAITGAVLFGFVVAHLLGNLQVFLGAEALNKYSAFLKSNVELLWPARIVLLTCVIAHIVVTIQLASAKSQARPVGYKKKNNSHSTLASRTMYYTGPMVAAFIVYHLLHMTLGTVHPNFEEGAVYANMVYGFQQWPVSLAYVVSIAFLCLHLNHGIYSFFQTMGFGNPRFKTPARVIAILIFLGYASIPAAILTGVVHL